MSALLAPLCWLIGAPSPDGMAPPLPPTPELPSYGGLLLRTLLALVVVLALAWVLLRWGMRRLLPGGAGGRPLRVVARVPLDGRRAAVLVEAAGRYLLLGVGEGSVTLLTELAPEAVAQALAAEAAARPRRFADVLKERMSRPSPPSPPPGRAPGEGSADDAAPDPDPGKRERDDA